MYQEALIPALDVHDGYFHVSDRPGLGHDLREDYLSRAIPY
jgi:L-alanine-DL-glutamate epimerase-like enolase superfamily enzyme